ncbi:hypothetical protein MMC34_004439 [Xylographa carneopallida]|nr:hypothetical protein [Xylographa carneopallida]
MVDYFASSKANLAFRTSPTLYLQIIGTARVTDFCGPLGSVYTNTIIPVATLSTLSYDVPIGGAIVNPTAAITKPLNTADLACPTWGIEPPNGGLLGSIVGPPFLPIIAPPPELLSLDPAWVSCSFANGEWFVSFGIFDPPYALTPIATLNQATSSLPPAISAVSTDPANNGPIIQYPAPPSGNSVSGAAIATALVPQKSLGANTVGAFIPDPTQAAPSTPSSSLDPGIPPVSTNLQSSQSNGATIGLGAIIYSVFGGSAPAPIPMSFASESLTVIDSSAIAVDGKTLQPGGSAVTQSNRVFSLDPSDSLIPIQPTQTAPGVLITPPPVLPAGLQSLTISPMPSGAVLIGGSTLVPGGSAITISGTPISLAPSGALVVGGSSIMMPNMAPNDPIATISATSLSSLAPGVVVFDGTSTIPLSPQQDITLGSQLFPISRNGPSTIIVGGHTLAPSAGAATIGGQVLSLEASGALVAGGTQTIALPPPPALDITIGGQSFSVDPLGASAVAVASLTLVVAGPGVTINGSLVTLASGEVVVVGGPSVGSGVGGDASGTVGEGAKSTGVGGGSGYNGTLFRGGAVGRRGGWRAGGVGRWGLVVMVVWVWGVCLGGRGVIV